MCYGQTDGHTRGKEYTPFPSEWGLKKGVISLLAVIEIDFKKKKT